MIYAHSLFGEKIGAQPYATGSCPECGELLQPKCGEKNVWHWAHLVESTCSANKEAETAWHRDWKLKFPKDWCEIKIGEHRADVQTSSGLVIEFQNSHLDAWEIRKREAHYDRMIWVVNATDCFERFSFKAKGDYHTFNWSHRRKWVDDLSRTVYIDLGWTLFRIGKSYGKYGWGNLITVGSFMESHIPNQLTLNI